MGNKQNLSTRRRYELSSMSHLHLEREKLRWQISHSEDKISADFRRICAIFTITNMVSFAISKVRDIGAVIDGVRNGYQTISSILQKRNAEKEQTHSRQNDH